MAENSLQATPEMVVYCYEVLIAHYHNRPAPTPAFATDLECPLFVTWEKESSRSSGGGGGGGGSDLALRGCIGTLAPRSLAVLKDYTYNSALHDRRFTPIAERELPRLHCSVSLLTDYEAARDCMDWTVGLHGLIINFTAADEAFSATYLPEIAAEQGWGKGEAIESLVRKAGYTGPVDRRLLAGIELTRYQSSKCTLSYREYRNCREDLLRAAVVEAGFDDTPRSPEIEAF